jgi:hypothetical protein
MEGTLVVGAFVRSQLDEDVVFLRLVRKAGGVCWMFKIVGEESIELAAVAMSADASILAVALEAFVTTTLKSRMDAFEFIDAAPQRILLD